MRAFGRAWAWWHTRPPDTRKPRPPRPQGGFARTGLTLGIVIAAMGAFTVVAIATGGGAGACMATLANPHACSFPDSTNTGLDGGATLTTITTSSTSGSGWSCLLRSTTPTCQDLFITGNIGSPTTGLEVTANVGIAVFIMGDNISIRNLKLDGGTGIEICGNLSSHGLCLGNPSGSNIAISHCDMLGDTSGVFSDAGAVEYGILADSPTSSLSVDHCNIHGYADGINIDDLDGSTSITNNWIHTPSCWDRLHVEDCPTSVANFGGTTFTDHINSVYMGGNNQTDQATSSVLIQHNTLDAQTATPCCVSDAIGFFDDSDPDYANNLHGLVDDNLMAAAADKCVNGDDDPASGGIFQGPTFLKLKRNHLITVGGCANGWIRGSTWWSGAPLTGTGNASCANEYDDGPFPGGADSFPSYPGTNGEPAAVQPITSSGC